MVPGCVCSPSVQSAAGSVPSTVRGVRPGGKWVHVESPSKWHSFYLTGIVRKIVISNCIELVSMISNLM